MVDFKAELINLVIHAMHFGKLKKTLCSLHGISCLHVDEMIFFCRVGSVLRILGGYKFIDKIALRRFLLTCQSEVLLLLPGT